MFDRFPPSRWIDLQAVDRLDQFGNLHRQFADGNQMVIQGNPPSRILISNAVTTKDLRLDVNGRIVDAYQINNITGATQQRPDCFGAIVDGYGAMHGVNGRVERRNGLISPNERAYVHGLISGFPERWAFLPQQQNGQFIPRPYYNNQRPHHHNSNPYHHNGRSYHNNSRPYNSNQRYR
ncbi:MAG: hypothetical protein K2Z81_23885 [Cyanobacteria bacterium]|nr:hypothetical protein [Cyanobacteriota bacterium]